VEVSIFTPAEESAASEKHREVNADCFFDTDGIIHKEFVPPGQTVNAKFYCNVLRWLRKDMREKRPGKWRTNNWVLHHDNAPAHTALAVQHFLASKNMTVVPQPPYSPDLLPCDFFLFPKMKIKLKGQRFDTIEEIQAKSQKVLKTLTPKDFQDSFRSWQKRWDRCVRSQGDYFEGDGGD
jgi:transposase